MDHTGRLLAVIEGGDLRLKLCRLPNSAALNVALKPRFDELKN